MPHTPFRLSHVDGPVPIYHGGPLVGVGARAGAPAEFRMRFGYEFAAPDWLIHGLAVDTDFEERVVLTPMIDAASPSVLFILPSVGLGLGVPIRIVPEATVGMRFQGTLQWPIVGFVTSIDVYPGSHVAAHDRVEATLLGRVSL